MLRKSVGTVFLEEKILIDVERLDVMITVLIESNLGVD